MRLLVITQKVDRNDAILGFFHRWLIEFGKHWTRVHVVCLQEGPHALPENISVFSLGKEESKSRLEYIGRFFKYIFMHRNDYDAVFIHMNPIYLVLAGWLWKLLHKPVGLWYVHKSADIKLRVAHFFADKVFTAVKESFPMKSTKLHVLGHGIEIDQFVCGPRKHGNGDNKEVQLLVVGRISKIKNDDVILHAAKFLKQSYNLSFQLTFVGAPISEQDERYFTILKKIVDEYHLNEEVRFIGEVPNYEVASYYCEADIVLNVGSTGGLDKTVIEAMAAKRLVLSTFSGLADFFAPYEKLLMPLQGSAESLAEKIVGLLECSERETITEHLYKTAEKHFAVGTLVYSLSDHLKEQLS